MEFNVDSISHKGRILEPVYRSKGRSRSRSPRPRYRDDYRDRNSCRKSHSRSRRRCEHDGHRGRDRDYCYRSRSHSLSPEYHKECGRGIYGDEKHSRSRSYGSASLVRRSLSPWRSPSPRRTPHSRGVSPDAVIFLYCLFLSAGVKEFNAAL